MEHARNPDMEEQHLSQEEVHRSLNRNTSRGYPFMGGNGVPQFFSPTAFYSKISPEPGLYPVHNAFTNSIAPKSALKKTSKDAGNKENVSPDLYEVKRRGSLAKIHRKKESDGNNKIQLLHLILENMKGTTKSLHPPMTTSRLAVSPPNKAKIQNL